MAAISLEYNDNSCPSTPPSSLAPIPVIETPEYPSVVDQLDSIPDGPSLASTLKLPSSNDLLSPTSQSTKPQHPFSLSDLLDGVEGGLEALGPDVAAADITVASGGAFIETSSGAAARKLKQRYDQLAGVGLNVRSPYAITAFVSQHGKQMYRLGHRHEHSAPGAAAAEVEERISQTKSSTDTSQSPRTKRRSVLSMAMFTKSGAQPPSRPPTTTPTVTRKLQRKTRSIPDLFSAALEEETVKSGATAPTFTVTGRGHSQSVTAVDLARPNLVFQPLPRDRKIDAFGELMDWFTPASSSSSNFSTHSVFHPGKASADSSRPREQIALPFGPSVTFNAPSQKPPIDRLPPPRNLRVMQSFESGLTARQDELPSNDSESDHDHELSRPPSAIRLSQLSSSSGSSDPAPPSEQDETISPESLRLSSHYSTEVFNVLQTYRGLPVFESLIPEVDEGTTVIRLSLAADQSAAPRDDPRFVIWGEALVEFDQDDNHSSSRESLDLSSSASMSKRRSSKISKLRSPESSTSRLPALAGGQKVLLAATIERWVAQLTSDLNYDELLNFFLTFRTYVSAVDLCHLLICRFNWALLKPTSSQDETVRRIVRVRTFVAIRYWLLTFFTVDFIPNRELRLLIADWLNTLLHDPILRRRNDSIGIVRRLAKVAKECKRAHTRMGAKPKATSPPRSAPETPGQATDHLLGKSFAEAVRKPLTDDDDSDLDLDFLPDEAKSDESGFANDPANAHLTVSHAVGSAVLSSTRPTSLPLSSFNILQRTDHAPGPSTDVEAHLNPAHIPHTARHSALSRAFVRTIGRLGRWKRVLNPRSSISAARPGTSLGVCGAGVSAFDLELSASKDLLTDVNGGVERYLKMTEPSATSISTPMTLAVHSPNLAPGVSPPPSHTSHVREAVVSSSFSSTARTQANQGEFELNADSPPSPISPLAGLSNLPQEIVFTQPSSPEILVASPPVPASLKPSINATTSDATSSNLEPHDDDKPLANPQSPSRQVSLGSFNDEVDRLSQADRPESFRSSSTDSFGAPLTSDGPLPPTFPGTHTQWQFDVVSIDELDFSDTSSIPGIEDSEDLAYPPGLRKPVRRLPMRREFEFVRRSEVSSMGIVSHESMRDSVSSSAASETSPTSSGGGARPIHRWQMKSLQQTFESTSNDGEEGDVEAALRRLEGQINPKVQQEKAAKVDGWVKTMQDRMANGDYDYESSLFSEDEIEGFIDEVDQSSIEADLDNEEDVDHEDHEYATGASAKTPLPTQTTHQIPHPPGLDNSSQTSDPATFIEVAVPLEILQSRLPTVETNSTLVNQPVEATISSKFAKPDAPRIHKSFILGYTAETLAQHFSMIDRELFISIKFEELVTDDWAECEEVEVLDWAQYLKDRARWKAESRFAEKTTALAALRARYNLIVAFVVAEVVLTAPAERHIVVGKFIRTAWKTYTLSNFHTLTAIIAALQGDWVNRAMRKHGWSRISSFEARIFRDLKQFTTNTEDFKFMRQVVDSIVDAKPLETNSHSASVISGGATDSQSGKGKAGSESRPAMPAACIPFIGIYLSQIHRLNKLPALIDPTAPYSIVSIDPITADFDPPAHPEVFSTLAPLPAAMRLEPLVNVHKQRRIADVIKSLVAGQHMASRVQFGIDRKLFQKCLRLRGLDSVYLERALAMYTD